jgi:hypothetical protein
MARDKVFTNWTTPIHCSGAAAIGSLANCTSRAVSTDRLAELIQRYPREHQCRCKPARRIPRLWREVRSAISAAVR